MTLCLFFHDWGLWVLFGEMTKKVRWRVGWGEVVSEETVIAWQKRKCNRCGKEERKKI